MPLTDLEAIKNIVRRNFDASSLIYEQFETRFGLFEYLTIELAKAAKVQPGMRICDIGCGTGTSSFVLREIVGSSGEVIGLDFSEKMLAVANDKLVGSESSNLDFIQCSADELEGNIEGNLDSVLYNACIFLIPDHKRSLQEAYNLLNENGTMGMNYLIGIYDKIPDNNPSDDNLFDRAKSDNKTFAPYGRAIVDTTTLGDQLIELGFNEVHNGVVVHAMPLDELSAFYCIPAQSAALWPKTNYEERLENLNLLIKYFKEKGIKKYYQ